MLEKKTIINLICIRKKTILLEIFTFTHFLHKFTIEDTFSLKKNISFSKMYVYFGMRKAVIEVHFYPLDKAWLHHFNCNKIYFDLYKLNLNIALITFTPCPNDIVFIFTKNSTLTISDPMLSYH